MIQHEVTRDLEPSASRLSPICVTRPRRLRAPTPPRTSASPS